MARRTSWQDRIISTTVVSGGVLNNDMLIDISRDEGRGATIGRLIADITIFSTTVAGAWGLQIVDIGFGMIERDALAASAVPDPNVSSDQPSRGWMFRTRCVAFQNGVGTVIGVKCMFDIRSQRRIDASTLGMLVVNTAGLGTNFTIGMEGIVRVLVILP